MWKKYPKGAPVIARINKSCSVFWGYNKQTSNQPWKPSEFVFYTASYWTEFIYLKICSQTRKQVKYRINTLTCLMQACVFFQSMNHYLLTILLQALFSKIQVKKHINILLQKVNTDKIMDSEYQTKRVTSQKSFEIMQGHISRIF